MALALLAVLATAVPANAPDVGYLPTPQSAVMQMLELAEVRPGELVYDLGCGDGRIVITAARKFGRAGSGWSSTGRWSGARGPTCVATGWASG
jgi:hypothetical protein